MWIWIVAVALVLLGIFLFSSNPIFKPKSREQFIKDIAQFVEGRIEPIPEKGNSIRINFTFENEPFVFDTLGD